MTDVNAFGLPAETSQRWAECFHTFRSVTRGRQWADTRATRLKAWTNYELWLGRFYLIVSVRRKSAEG
jgi:hypothetical protein